MGLCYIQTHWIVLSSDIWSLQQIHKIGICPLQAPPIKIYDFLYPANSAKMPFEKNFYNIFFATTIFLRKFWTRLDLSNIDYSSLYRDSCLLQEGSLIGLRSILRLDWDHYRQVNHGELKRATASFLWAVTACKYNCNESSNGNFLNIKTAKRLNYLKLKLIFF